MTEVPVPSWILLGDMYALEHGRWDVSEIVGPFWDERDLRETANRYRDLHGDGYSEPNRMYVLDAFDANATHPADFKTELAADEREFAE
jgi:hypothetical protein